MANRISRSPADNYLISAAAAQQMVCHADVPRVGLFCYCALTCAVLNCPGALDIYIPGLLMLVSGRLHQSDARVAEQKGQPMRAYCRTELMKMASICLYYNPQGALLSMEQTGCTQQIFQASLSGLVEHDHGLAQALWTRADTCDIGWSVRGLRVAGGRLWTRSVMDGLERCRLCCAMNAECEARAHGSELGQVFFSSLAETARGEEGEEPYKTHFRGLHDQKIAILGLTSILKVPAAQLPPVVAQGLPTVVSALVTLEKELERNRRKKEEAAAAEDEEVSFHLSEERMADLVRRIVNRDVRKRERGIRSKVIYEGSQGLCAILPCELYLCPKMLLRAGRCEADQVDSWKYAALTVRRVAGR